MLNVKQFLSALLVLGIFLSSTGYAFSQAQQPAPPPPSDSDAQGTPTAPGGEITPARVSYLNGEVSFWRPGASDWTPAKVNTPLAPGDVFYTGSDGTVEIQVGPRAFVRAAPGAQIALDNHEPDYIQLRLTAGHAAVDIRELGPGDTLELATPGAAFTIERNGYYHAEVSEDTTTFRAHRGGSATMTPAGGAATPVAANQQAVVTGTESPRVVVGAAPALTAWDQWNYQRTDYLTQPASARYVPQGVYGTETLDQHGTWRNVESYGNVWVPTTVAAGWVPYSTGRWIWDPRFGWTWLDDAPWGWAPYHYGRWVHVHNYWAWAPGPVVVRPVYSPALVVFLGGGVHLGVSLGRPVYWAPLGWGEPCVPWWGRRGFVGVPSWQGWGGPRVVNNVVINNTTVVNVQNINVYRNVTVNNAVVGVPADRFGRGAVVATRANTSEVRQLAPVRGALEVKPVAASVVASNGSAAKPPVSVQNRRVVATRAPRDQGQALREQGLPESKPVTVEPAPKLVPAPAPTVTRSDSPRRDNRPTGAPERGERNDGVRGAERPVPAQPPAAPAPAPAPRVRDEGQPEPRQGAPAQPPAAPAPAPAPRGRDEGRPEPRQGAPAQPPAAPAPAPAPRGRDEGRPEPRQGGPAQPPAAPAPAPAPRGRDEGRPELRQGAPAQPPAAPAPAPSPRGRDEGRPELRQGAPAQPPAAPAPAPAPRGRDEGRPELRQGAPAQPPAAPAPAPAPRGRDEGRPEPRPSAPAPQPPPAPRGRDEGRPDPRLNAPSQPPVAPSPMPTPRGRDEGRPEPRSSVPGQPNPAPAAPAPRPRQEVRPEPRVMPPAQPARAPAPAPAPPARIERPAQIERPAPTVRPAPVERPATAQPEPRTRRLEPGAPSVGPGGAGAGGRGAGPESGPRTKNRD